MQKRRGSTRRATGDNQLVDRAHAVVPFEGGHRSAKVVPTTHVQQREVVAGSLDAKGLLAVRREARAVTVREIYTVVRVILRVILWAATCDPAAAAY